MKAWGEATSPEFTPGTTLGGVSPAQCRQCLPGTHGGLQVLPGVVGVNSCTSGCQGSWGVKGVSALLGQGQFCLPQNLGAHIRFQTPLF